MNSARHFTVNGVFQMDKEVLPVDINAKFRYSYALKRKDDEVLYRYIYCAKKSDLQICSFYLFETDTREFHDSEGFVVEVVKIRFNSDDYNSAVRNSYTKDTGKLIKEDRDAFIKWRFEKDV